MPGPGDNITTPTTRHAADMASQMVKEIVKNEEFIQLMDDVVSKALDKRIPDFHSQLQSIQVTLQAWQEIQTEKGNLAKEIQTLKALKEVIEGKDERICVLEGKIHDLQCKNDEHATSIDSNKKQLESHENKISALERNEEQMQQYSRRNCIRVFGIPEELQGEDTDDKICHLVQERLGVNIKKDDIDRSHRVGKKSTSKRGRNQEVSS